MVTLLLAMAPHTDAHGNGRVAPKSGIEAAAPALQLKQKPDGSSIGILVAAIENGLVKSWLSRTGRNASGTPGENASGEASPSGDETLPEQQENVRNETSVAKTQAGQVQNVSVHYKTVRVAEAVPLDAVLLEEMPPERNSAVQPHIIKLKASGTLQAQPVSASVTDEIRPQKLDTVPSFAKPDDDAGRAAPGAALEGGGGVAVYDIERGMVYLPDGERLEAHSGMGPMRDNPAYVNRRNRGPTPPHIYNLKLRERLFHGVEAIRLTPVDGEAAVFGRAGFLAHTYMLRTPGDSNGCVVFRDYRRFLAAFKKGLFNRLVVVPRLRGAPASMTALLAAKNG